MELQEQFQHPEDHIGLIPAWYPLDHFEDHEIEKEIDLIISYGIKAVLLQPCRKSDLAYHSPEWFERLKHTLDILHTRKMPVWIFDDYLDLFQNNVSDCLNFYDFPPALEIKMKATIGIEKKLESKDDKIVAQFFYHQGSWDIFDQHKDDIASYIAKQGLQAVASRVAHDKNQERARYWDILHPQIAKQVEQSILKKYQMHLSPFFEQTIKGFLVSDPGFPLQEQIYKKESEFPSLPWSNHLPEYFKSAYHYDLLNHLPLLWMEDHLFSRRVRRDYYNLLMDMYQHHFISPLKQWFESQQLQIVAHFEYQDILQANSMIQRDFMQEQKSYSMPGLYRSTFSKSDLPEKLVSSNAHLSDKQKIFSSNLMLHYQGSSVSSMKQWMDRQFCNGINNFFMQGCSIAEFLQNPQWKHFPLLNDYIRRFSFLCHQGAHFAPVGLFYPIENIYSFVKPHRWNEANRITHEVRELCDLLLQHQIDFDFIHPESLKHANLTDKGLCMGEEYYKVLIFPHCHHLSLREMKQLHHFVEKGGFLIFLDELPTQCLEVDDMKKYSELFNDILKSTNVYSFMDTSAFQRMIKMPEIYKIMDVLEQIKLPSVRLQDQDPEIRILQRKVKGKDFFIIHNLSRDHKYNALVFLQPDHLETWSLESGTIQPLHYRYHEKKNIVTFHLYPNETRVYVNQRKASKLFTPTIVMQNGVYQLMKSQLTVDGLPSEFLLRGEWKLTLPKKTCKIQLKPWESLKLGQIDGFVEYEKIFNLPGEYLNFKLILDLGAVRDCAEVIFNGHTIGTRMWEPYRFLLNKYARRKNNVLSVKVCNTLGPFSSKSTISGLIGPVRLLPFKEI